MKNYGIALAVRVNPSRSFMVQCWALSLGIYWTREPYNTIKHTKEKYLVIRTDSIHQDTRLFYSYKKPKTVPLISFNQCIRQLKTLEAE